jgi:sugar phosphate isomerase/epimerase
MQPARLAFSTLAFPAATLAQAASFGRSCGYRGIELRLIDGELIDPAMPAADRARVSRTIADAGLAIVAVDSSIRLTDVDSGTDPGAELRKFLELASDWQAPLVRVFGGPLPADPADRRAGLAAAAQVLNTVIPVADRLGVRVGVETHDDFAAASTVAELLALVESQTVGAVWDSHHPHRVGEGPADVYASIGPRVLLAQVKDARRSPERADGWQLVLLGQGEVPVREMLSLLSAGGYQGWISVEWEKRWHAEIEDPEIALPQHFELLETWMRQLEEARQP